MKHLRRFSTLFPNWATTQTFRSEHVNHFPYRDVRNRVKLVVLDWSGTTVDAHVIAPAKAFVDAFALEGIPLSVSEAREPMGLRKDLHIAKLLEIPAIRARFKALKGREPNAADVQSIFKKFLPIQIDVLRDHSDVLPGIAESIAFVRKNYDVKIGVTTGFNREMVEAIKKTASKQGFTPDIDVAGDDIENGMGFRPAPFMVMRNMERAGVYDRRTVIKVDDTIGGVGEGLNAGVWTVATYKYSNYTDIDSLEQWRAMSPKEFASRSEKARQILAKSGAHYVIEDLNYLPAVIQDVNLRLERGEEP